MLKNKMPSRSYKTLRAIIEAPSGHGCPPFLNEVYDKTHTPLDFDDVILSRPAII